MVAFKGYYKRSCRSPYNAVVGVRLEADDDFITVAEAKANMRIDFGDEDTYITTLIKASRQMIEKYTWLCLVPTTVTAILHNDIAGMEVPYGPVTDTITVGDKDGVDLDTDAYRVEGLDFPQIIQSSTDTIKISYPAGYDEDTMPADLKLAVLHQVAWLYENRGDGTIGASAKKLADPYRRMTWLL